MVRRGQAGQRGSVLVESVAAGLILVLAVAFNVDILIRACHALCLHHSAFLYVRERALGTGVARSRTKARVFLKRALGERRGGAMSRSLRVSESYVGGEQSGLEASFYYHWPSLLRFPYGEKEYQKHDFELTETCRFRF